MSGVLAKPLMKAGWHSRLLEALQRDGRDMKAISKASGLGPNYVQQLVRYRKKPRIDSFVKLLEALGRTDALYIITGNADLEVDDRLYRAFDELDETGKEAVIAAFVALRASQRK